MSRSSKPSRKDRAKMASRYVNMWAFLKMHPSNVDLLQRLKSADDRQFGTNMDVCGTVATKDDNSRAWDKTHLVGIRNDVWNSGPGRRLVLKLFKTTGERLRWIGTIEEITTREVHNTIGCRRAVLNQAVILPGFDYLVNIQQNHRTFRIPSIFTFCFHDENQDRVWYIDIRRKWVSIGADFEICSGKQSIGEIDGKLIGFGYNAYVHVTEPKLAANHRFLDLLTLFATSVGYHRAMRRAIRHRVRAIRAGQPADHVIEDEEFWLLKNPRRHAA